MESIGSRLFFRAHSLLRTSFLFLLYGLPAGVCVQLCAIVCVFSRIGGGDGGKREREDTREVPVFHDTILRVCVVPVYVGVYLVLVNC